MGTYEPYVPHYARHEQPTLNPIVTLEWMEFGFRGVGGGAGVVFGFLAFSHVFRLTHR